LYFGTVERGPWEAGPALKPVPAGNEALTDGGFEHLGEAESPWDGIGLTFAPAAEAHAGKQSALCSNPTEDAVSGVFQQVQLDQAQPLTLVVTGWSQAENVSGDPDAHYSLWADLQYTDGTFLYGQSAAFDCGSHDWQRREVVIHPAKPVAWIKVFGLFRRHSGKAWFDHLSLREVERYRLYVAERLGADGSIRVGSAQTAQELKIATEDGLSLGFDAVSGAVSEVKLDERAWTHPVAWPHSGLCLRDAAQDSLPLPVRGKLVATEHGVRQEGRLAGLGLEAEAQFIAHPMGTWPAHRERRLGAGNVRGDGAGGGPGRAQVPVLLAGGRERGPVAGDQDGRAGGGDHLLSARRAGSLLAGEVLLRADAGGEEVPRLRALPVLPLPARRALGLSGRCQEVLRAVPRVLRGAHRAAGLLVLRHDGPHRDTPAR
jgi:hypothetical protein